MCDKDNLLYNRLNFNFTNSFEQEYSLLNMKGRQVLLRCAVQMYRRWLYSALIPNTMVTPVNFYSCVSEDKMPVIYPKSLKRFCGFNVGFLDTSLDTHYILEDTDVVINAALGGIRVVGNRVEGEAEHNIMKKLNLPDPGYLVFLLEILERLGCIKLMPSINTRVYVQGKPEKKTDLNMLADAACKIAADKLNGALGGEYINSGDIWYLIRSETAVDRFAEYILEAAGVYNASDIMAKDISECSGYEKAVYLLINKLIPAIDKYFIRVFGFYFRLIKPVYTQRYCMKYELEMMSSLLKGKYTEGERESYIYRCPAMYSLTRLGAQVTGSSYNNIQGYIFNKVDPELLLISIDEQEKLIAGRTSREKLIYTVKIECPKLPETVYTVRFLADTVLNEVWGEIYRLFELESQIKGCRVRFSFEREEQTLKNIAFSSDEKDNRSCFKAKLSDIVYNIGQRMICTTQISSPGGILSDRLEFKLTVVNVSKDTEGHFYPAVVKNR